MIRFDLYPYQRCFLESRAAQRIVVKARQVGVSQAIAGEALCLARQHSGAKVLFVSHNLAAAQHLLGMVYELMASDKKLPVLRKRSASIVALANGSVIRSLPATRRGGRTFSATAVYLDEFAHMPWADEIYQAVTPCAAQGGRVTVVSTPRGKANAFYRLWQEAGVGGNLFERHVIHWSECPEYNPEGFLIEDGEKRRRVGEAGIWYGAQRARFTDDQWAQEYECDFAGSGSLVYREFDPQVHVGNFSHRPEWPVYVGQDFGYVNPSVALIIQVSPSDEVFVIEEHYDRNRSIGELAERLYRPIGVRYGVQAWYCDPSGATEIAELKRVGLPARACRSPVAEGVLAIRKLLRPPTGGPPRLYIDRGCQRLIGEMSRYEYCEGVDRESRDVDDHGPDALRYFVVNHFRGEVDVEGVELR